MNTRRRFLFAATLTWLFGFWRRRPAIAAAAAADQRDAEPHCKRYFNQPLDEWLDEVRGELPCLVQILATFERRGVQYENPATWYRQNYVGAVPWRPGVFLVYGFGRQREAEESFAAADAWLEREGVTSLATGFSDDRRAWTRFVLASDREALAPLVSSSIAPLITSASVL